MTTQIPVTKHVDYALPVIDTIAHIEMAISKFWQEMRYTASVARLNPKDWPSSQSDNCSFIHRQSADDEGILVTKDSTVPAGIIRCE